MFKKFFSITVMFLVSVFSLCAVSISEVSANNNLCIVMFELVYSPSSSGLELNVPSQTVSSGGLAVRPIELEEKDFGGYGYLFYFYTDADCQAEWNFNMPVHSDTIIYVEWLVYEGGYEYTVTFNTNGGSYISPQELSSDDPNKQIIVRPNDPTKRGYVFDGWYLDEDFTESFDFSYRPLGVTVIHAKWITESSTSTTTESTNNTTTTNATISTPPRTGDKNEVAPLIFVCTLSLISAVVIICKQKSKQ